MNFKERIDQIESAIKDIQDAVISEIDPDVPEIECEALNSLFAATQNLMEEFEWLKKVHSPK